MDQHHLAVVFERRGGGVHVELAQLPAEGELSLRSDVLIAEEEDEVLGEGGLDLGPGLVVHLPEVDAAHLGADGRRERFDDDQVQPIAGRQDAVRAPVREPERCERHGRGSRRIGIDAQ